MSDEITRWSHALEDYYTEPQAIRDGLCRCHSKMVEAPRSGEYVLHSDHVAARKADQERIAELEAEVAQWREECDNWREQGQGDGRRIKAQAESLAAAEKLADAVQGFYDAHLPNERIAGGPSLEARGVMSEALAAFRASLSTGENK